VAIRFKQRIVARFYFRSRMLHRRLTFLVLIASACSGGAQEPFAKVGVPFLEKHCTSCHGAEKQKADLTLHEYRDELSLLKKRKIWKHVIEMVESEEMPPDDKPQPTKEERAAFVVSAKAVFTNYDKTAKPDPGRVTIRRLNREEYNNTLRDLLGVDTRPANDFPSDGVGYGFDNIGDVLSISPLLMERYLDAAQTVAEQAIPLEKPKPPTKRTASRNCEPAGPA